jgi:hypothetical protein
MDKFVAIVVFPTPPLVLKTMIPRPAEEGVGEGTLVSAMVTHAY